MQNILDWEGNPGNPLKNEEIVDEPFTSSPRILILVLQEESEKKVEKGGGVSLKWC